MKSNNRLQYRHIKEPTIEILRYIDDRRKGINNSLKTKWEKFNRQCMGGLEPNTVYTIAGISGSGKSSLVNSLENDLFDLNPNSDFVVLSFNFEMLSSRQVGRKLSYKMRKTTAQLYSGLGDKGERLANKNYDEAVKHAEEIMKYPIYYVDSPGTVDEISNTINYFQDNLVKLKKGLVIILDHTLLVRSVGKSERETLYDLQRLFMQVKKKGQTTIIQISQMNREIESTERILNPSMHYPIRKDIYGSDSLFQSSDYVIVIHRPQIIGIRAYGPSNLPVENMIYMHFLKAREGEPKILSFYNNLKYNSIEEVDPFNIKINKI